MWSRQSSLVEARQTCGRRLASLGAPPQIHPSCRPAGVLGCTPGWPPPRARLPPAGFLTSTAPLPTTHTLASAGAPRQTPGWLPPPAPLRRAASTPARWGPPPACACSTRWTMQPGSCAATSGTCCRPQVERRSSVAVQEACPGLQACGGGLAGSAATAARPSQASKQCTHACLRLKLSPHHLLPSAGAALVVFEYAEHAANCIEDHHRPGVRGLGGSSGSAGNASCSSTLQAGRSCSLQRQRRQPSVLRPWRASRRAALRKAADKLLCGSTATAPRLASRRVRVSRWAPPHTTPYILERMPCTRGDEG